MGNADFSPVSVDYMYGMSESKYFYDKSSMANFSRFRCCRDDEWHVVDLTNALRNAKECRRWMLTVKANDDGYVEPLCNLLIGAGINTTAEFMDALRAGSLRLDGVSIVERSADKGVKTFSPFAVMPIKEPKRWNVLLAVKAILAGQAIIENCNWGDVFNAVKDATDGCYSYSTYKTDDVVRLFANYSYSGINFKFSAEGGAFPDGCSNILEAVEWQKEVDHKAEEERIKRELEERENRFNEEKAMQSIVEDAIAKYPLSGILPPYVEILWSEHLAFVNLIPDREHPLKMSILAANEALGKLDMNRFEEGIGGYDKTRFTLHYIDPISGSHRTWEDRYDLGDGHGSLLNFMEHYRPRTDLTGLFTVLDAYNAVLSSENGECVNTTVAIWDGLEAFCKAYMGNKGNN